MSLDTHSEVCRKMDANLEEIIRPKSKSETHKIYAHVANTAKEHMV